MCAWIEADVEFEGIVGGADGTAQRLNAWCLENCKGASNIAGTHKGGIAPHMTLLYHGHPISESLYEALQPLHLSSVVARGVTKGVAHAQTRPTLVLSITSNDMGNLFERVYESVRDTTKQVPEHTLLEGYYKHFDPHITLAHYETCEQSTHALAALPTGCTGLEGRSVVIRNFRLYEWRDGTGAHQFDLP